MQQAHSRSNSASQDPVLISRKLGLRSSCRHLQIPLLAGFFALAGSLSAQNVSTWTGLGGDALWSNPLNWDIPAAETTNPDRTVIFAGTNNLSPVQDIGPVGGGGFNLNSIIFANGAGSFELKDSNGFGVDMLGTRNTGTPAYVRNLSVNAQTIDFKLISRSDFTSSLVFDTSAGDLIVKGQIVSNGNAGYRGGITKEGTGTLILTNTDNTFQGNTLIRGGVLSVASTYSLGSAGGVVSQVHFDGGTLRWTGPADSTGRVWVLLAGGGTFDSSGTGAYTRTSSFGPISGVGSFTKTGAQALIMTAANTYEGETIVNQGALNIRHSQGLGATSGGVRVVNGAELQLQGSNLNITESHLILGGTNATQGTLRNISGNNTWNGDITAQYVANLQSDANLLTIQGNVHSQNGNSLNLQGNGSGRIQGDVTNVWRLAKSGAGTWEVGGNYSIASGGQGVEVTGGTLVLKGNSSHESGVLVNGGILNVQSNQALGTSSGGTTVYGDGQLQLQGGVTIQQEPLTLGNQTPASRGTLTNVSGNNRWVGNITANYAATLRSQQDLLTIEGNFNAQSGNSLTLEGAGDGLITGNVSNTWKIAKTGTGTWTLGGTNTFVAADSNPEGIEVSGGTLQIGVGGNGSVNYVNAPNAVTHVRNQGTLAGTGLMGIDTTIHSGGRLSAGDQGGQSKGVMRFDRNLTQQAGSYTLFQIATPDAHVSTYAELDAVTDLNTNAGGNDMIRVAQSLNLLDGSIVELDFTGYAPVWGDLFDLYDFEGDSLGSLPEFRIVGGDLGGFHLDTRFFQSSGILAVVPEPQKALLTMLGLTAGLVWRRRS